MSSWACRFTASTEFQRAASMLTSSLSRVMPALCTTMSTPPCRSRRCVDQPLRRVGGGDVELQRRPADLVGHLGQRLPGGRDVDGDDVRAVPGQHPGDRGADAAGGAGDDGDLAGAAAGRRPHRSGTSAADSVTTWPST